MPVLIKVDNLSYSYMPRSSLEVKALHNISFTVEQGEFTGIIGSTGSGKSTLLQHLNGLLLPQQGRVFIDGESITAPGFPLAPLRRRCGLLFQYPEHHFFAESVYDEIAFGPRNMGLADRVVRERVEESLALAGLEYRLFKDRSPYTLSGGEMRRVALAGTLAMGPEVLLLDEPTSGLDPAARRELLLLMKQLHERDGRTIILVSHNMEDISLLCRKVMVLFEGRLVLQGSRAEIFADRPRLMKYGLDLPPVPLIMHKLQEQGMKVRTAVFNRDEACREILGQILPGEII